MAEKHVHVKIIGQVQGVYFRAWTVDTATNLELKGWVRNRKDGSVEAVFSGEEEAIDAMIDACHSGPEAADVDEIITNEIDYEPDEEEFHERPTV